MAGYGRRGTGKPTMRQSKWDRRRQTVAAALIDAEGPSRRIGIAASYVMGAVQHIPEDQAERHADRVVDLLLAQGDRIWGGGGGRS
jgi:hypothetical protein